MTPQELKNSILQLAIQGKLVEQRPDEGTAEELYRQIQAEKQQLIKTGKIKKEKPLPEISEDEKPFDIPESWRWTYIGELFQHNTGKALNSSDKSGVPYEYITTSNVYWNEFKLDNLKSMLYTDSEVERCTVLKNDLLVLEGGDIGRAAIWNYDFPMRIQNHIHRLRPFGKICIEYIYQIFFLYKFIGLINGKGIGIQGLSANALHRLIIPLPPFDEQKRIVAKIEELLPYIDRYEQAWSKLEEFNKRFPGDMQKSILQMAIQGKLVEQRPEEGTGEELYRQIQAEKQRLIKAGKIRKEKPLPEITEDEKPFDIPESWNWVYLQNAAMAIVDCPHSTPTYYEKETDYHAIDTTCIDENGSITGRRYVDELTYLSRVSRLVPMKNDIVYTREGSICRAAILNKAAKICLGQRVMLIRCPNEVSPNYMKRFLMAPQTIQYLTQKQRGIGAKHVNVSDVCSLLIPLPPYAEQKRIVEKLEGILPLCEKLK